jgi:hypothetical protein
MSGRCNAATLGEGVFDMRNVSIVAAAAVFVGLAGVGQAVANGSSMGDPSVHQREIQERCAAQKRGELPPYPNACPSWDADTPVHR